MEEVLSSGQPLILPHVPLNAPIQLRHKHWKTTPIPFGHQEQSVRDWYHARVRWCTWRDLQLGALYDAFVTKRDAIKVMDLPPNLYYQAISRKRVANEIPPWHFQTATSPRLDGSQPGIAYKYFNWTWTHTHPNRDWPEWWAEQSDRLRWLHHSYGYTSPWDNPRNMWATHPIHPEVWKQVPLHLLSQMIMISPSAGGSASEESAQTPANGDYVIDVNDLSGIASDSNDGILGSGGPWLTAQKGFEEIDAGTASISSKPF